MGNICVELQHENETSSYTNSLHSLCVCNDFMTLEARNSRKQNKCSRVIARLKDVFTELKIFVKYSLQ